MIQTTIPQVLNCYWKDLLQKRANLVLQRWSNLASRKLMRSSSKCRRIQCTIQKRLFLLKKGSGMTFPAYKHFKGDSLSAENSKLVMRLVRRYDQDERENQTALFIVIRWVQNCEKQARRPKATNSRTQIGVNTFMKEATERGTSIARIPKNVLFFIRATHGHTGGDLIALDFMGHVAIPYRWKKFLFHRGCSFDVTSILRSGLIAGGRESKEGTQTIFFTPLTPTGDNPDEE